MLKNFIQSCSYDKDIHKHDPNLYPKFFLGERYSQTLVKDA